MKLHNKHFVGTAVTQYFEEQTRLDFQFPVICCDLRGWICCRHRVGRIVVCLHCALISSGELGLYRLHGVFRVYFEPFKTVTVTLASRSFFFYALNVFF